MVEWIRTSDRNCLALTFHGRLTRKLFEQSVRPTLESTIALRGPVRWLVDIRLEHDIEPMALWEDLGLEEDAPKYAVEKLAVVGDRADMARFIDIVGPLVEGESRFFDRDDAVAAWEWVGAEMP